MSNRLGSPSDAMLFTASSEMSPCLNAIDLANPEIFDIKWRTDGRRTIKTKKIIFSGLTSNFVRLGSLSGFILLHDSSEHLRKSRVVLW